MIKSKLIEKVALANPHLFQRDVELIVNVIFDEIVNSLASGERVELRGFGAFSVKRRPARSGRNPRTGEQVMVDEKFVPYFKTGKELRQRMNKASETKSKVKSAPKVQALPKTQAAPKVQASSKAQAAPKEQAKPGKANGVTSKVAAKVVAPEVKVKAKAPAKAKPKKTPV